MSAPTLIGLEQAFRSALTSPRDKRAVADALSWDDSQVSRFLSGQQGIPIDKLDAAIQALGYVPVTPRYLDCLAYMGQIGASCQCARQGMGECGRH
ncbi:helix-turn-helix domain-containing protein [Microvirgula aerodenitrificans]|uniref:helix-turn-helix domain-containing protein n=1 Tax=Microvirgula aerodenitrificans TaxID=57480 RepID=UPI00048BEFB4|nr:helix-turn-helix transcriptional regulator [Microvirgula aerodenitrificans]